MTMTWTYAPAGFPCLRGSDARPAVEGLAVQRVKFGASAPVFLVQGTGVSVAGAGAIGNHIVTPMTSLDGTPLGIPSSRRPLS